MKTKILLLSLVISFLTISCNKDDDENSGGSASFTSDEAKVNSQIDAANDDISDAVEKEFNATNNDQARPAAETTTDSAFRLGAACATVTRIPSFGTTLTPGTAVSKTIDFGSGCTLQNGNIIKGKIVITFTYQPGAASHTINYHFDDFYHNNIKFEGDKVFTRTLVPATATVEAHPKVVMEMNLTATFPDGRIFTRVGNRTREMIEGYSSPLNVFNDVHQVTGQWTTTYPNTTVQTSEITTPLIVKMNCLVTNKPLLVQGVITFTRNGNSATLDYGDGTCDNLAVFKVNGNSYNIVIGN